MELVVYDRDFAEQQRKAHGIPMDTEGSRGSEESEEPRRRVGRDFYEVKVININLTPIEPGLRFHHQKFLELERVAHQTNLHPGGIDSRVRLSGFSSRQYEAMVKELLEERKQLLGMTPVGITKKKMREKLEEYYTQAFRGETAVTQVVAAEWRVTKHVHTGRPAGSHCFKCRLQMELGFLARVYYLKKAVPEMVWYNTSDIESADEGRREKIKDVRHRQWDKMHGISKQTRRSKRRVNTRPAVETPAEDEDDSTETKEDLGGLGLHSLKKSGTGKTRGGTRATGSTPLTTEAAYEVVDSLDELVKALDRFSTPKKKKKRKRTR